MILLKGRYLKTKQINRIIAEIRKNIFGLSFKEKIQFLLYEISE
jgi:hypothetical protein